MYVLLFFACSFLGWCMEVTCKLVQFGRFINRGFLLGPLCPIYGTGAVLMAYFLPLWTTQVESTFLLALVLCGTLEYITSWLMVQYGDRRMLFAGDNENRSQQYFAANPPEIGLNADIFKYPHHGRCACAMTSWKPSTRS